MPDEKKIHLKSETPPTPAWVDAETPIAYRLEPWPLREIRKAHTVESTPEPKPSSSGSKKTK